MKLTTLFGGMRGVLQSVAVYMLAISLVVAPISNAAYACAFHFLKPERTAVDWILDAETLVLARPDEEEPFTYQTVEVLRGAETGHEIPFLVNSLDRRTLANNPNEAVLFARINDTPWTKVAYIDEDFRRVLEIILANEDTWNVGYSPERFAVFEALQSVKNPTLRELAIRELDKAPYGILQKIDLQIPTEDLIADLWTPTGYPYQQIRILLLGLSSDDRARAEIYGYFARTQNWEWANNIGAFSAALIELDGVAGVTYLNEALLSGHTQPLDKVGEVISALAVHRSVAASDVSTAIDQVVVELITVRPETAPIVARQFAATSDWSQAGALEKLMREKQLMTTADLMAVSVYVAQARGQNQP